MTGRHPLALALALALSLAGALATRDASAFCRTTTETAAGALQANLSSCQVGGFGLWWGTTCVGYTVQSAGSKYATPAQAEAAAGAAFAEWTSAACPGGGVPSMAVVDQGLVACSSAVFNASGANQNVLIFRDDAWPYDDGTDTLAKTTVTYDADTGQILDADIELNTAMHVITPNPKKGEYDLSEVLAHEEGHFLGLAHTPIATATMYAFYDGKNQKTLSADDVAAVCTLYPPDGSRSIDQIEDAGVTSRAVARPSCDPTPVGGLGNACADPVVDAGFPDADDTGPVHPSSCDAAPGRPRGGGAFVLIVGAAVMVTRSRRRSRPM